VRATLASDPPPCPYPNQITAKRFLCLVAEKVAKDLRLTMCLVAFAHPKGYGTLCGIEERKSVFAKFLLILFLAGLSLLNFNAPSILYL